MKKDNKLFKLLLITFVCIIFLSWIIPIGKYESGSFVSGSITPVGIFDLALIPVSVFDSVIPTIILIVMVGGLYGILNKTGVYANMIDVFAKKLKGKEIKFLVITTIILSILSSVVGLNISFFVVIPFIAAILLSLNFSKMTTMIATFGSILTGSIGNLFGVDISYYLDGYLSYGSDFSYTTSIWVKIVLLVIVVTLLVLYIIKNGKKDLKENNKLEEIPLLNSKEKSKKSWVPLFIILVISFIFILVGSFKWDSVLGTEKNATPFLTFYNNIMDVKINNFPIIQNILGTVPALGYWEIPFISVFVFFITLLISVIYKLGIENVIEGFSDGFKKVLKVLLYVIGANLVMSALFKNGTSANFGATIINYIMNLTQTFNALLLSITTIISSFLYNNFATMIGSLYVPTAILTGTATEIRFTASIIMQTLYSLVMFIAPTSVLLIAGLSYFDISYKEWFKNIWKLLLQFLGVVIAIIVILAIFSV